MTKAIREFLQNIYEAIGRFLGKDEAPETPAVPEKEPEGTPLERLIEAQKNSLVTPERLKAITLAQWLLESGRGSSELSAKYYNFGGLKWREEMRGAAEPVLYKAHDGEDRYCAFSSPTAFIEGYWRFIGRSVYTGWEKYKESPHEFIRFIVACGYCPDPGYANKVFALENEAYKLLHGELKPEPPRELPAPGDEGQVHLGIIVGHTKSAKGAYLSGGGNEYDYNSEVARIIEQKAAAYFPQIQVSTIFRDGVGISGAYAKATKLGCDCVIELHYNAFNGQVEGTETLCTPDAKDKEFATFVQEQMCRVFDRTGMSRGVKPISRSGRGGGNVHAFTAGANCLVEPFFGDNPSEATMARNRKDQYASCLLGAVQAWAKKVELI